MIYKNDLIMIMGEDLSILLTEYKKYCKREKIELNNCYSIIDFQNAITDDIGNTFTDKEIEEYNNFENLETLITEIGCTLTSEFE